jgi:hypothetical protein
MKTTICDTAAEAAAGVADGATVLIGGFGMAGIPLALIEALIEQGARDLTVVNNNAGNGDAGLAALLAKGQVRKVICSFPRQKDSWVFDARLIEAGVDASVGSVGDAYDNALAESQVGIYKTELIGPEGPLARRRARRDRHHFYASGSSPAAATKSPFDEPWATRRRAPPWTPTPSSGRPVRTVLGGPRRRSPAKCSQKMWARCGRKSPKQALTWAFTR